MAATQLIPASSVAMLEKNLTFLRMGLFPHRLIPRRPFWEVFCVPYPWHGTGTLTNLAQGGGGPPIYPRELP